MSWGIVCLCHAVNGVCRLSPPAALYNDPCSNHRHQRVECVDVAGGNGDGEAQKKSCPLLHWRTWSKSKIMKLSHHGNSTQDTPNDWADVINRMCHQPQWIKNTNMVWKCITSHLLLSNLLTLSIRRGATENTTGLSTLLKRASIQNGHQFWWFTQHMFRLHVWVCQQPPSYISICFQSTNGANGGQSEPVLWVQDI